MNTRDYNIGESNYSTFPKGYQPWDLWRIFRLNPFDADILKRLLRTKVECGKTELESRREDYEKIVHISQECLRQIDEGQYERYYTNVTQQHSNIDKENLYVLVQWPESQVLLEHPRANECICVSINTEFEVVHQNLMCPKDLYEQVFSQAKNNENTNNRTEEKGIS